jgi:hypothetical protein
MATRTETPKRTAKSETKAGAKPAAVAKLGQKPAEKSADRPRPAPRVAFPKKAHPPTDAEFAARLPAPVGKRFEALRGFLDKQGAAEDFFYYGPRTGWAYRYLIGEKSLCSILIQAGRLVGIVALDAGAQAGVAWDGLSEIARRARRVAHGTPALLWLDVPLDGPGATDFKALLKAKLAAPAR